MVSAFDDGIYYCFDLFAPGDVRRESAANLVSAILFGHNLIQGYVQQALSAGNDEDVGSVTSQQTGRGLANTARSAGDDHVLPCEVHPRVSSLLNRSICHCVVHCSSAVAYLKASGWL